MSKFAYLSLFFFTCITQLQASALIFSEDFESLTPGTALSGQGGWTNIFGAGTSPLVGPSIHLGSNVSDGFTSNGGTSLSVVSHAIANPNDGIVKLQSDVYAKLTTPNTHNAGVLFTDSTFSTQVGWASYHVPGSPTAPTWRFEIFSSTTGHIFETFSDPAFFGVVNQLETIIDYENGLVTGKAILNGGQVQTSTFAIDSAVLAALDMVSLTNDYRGSVGPTTGLQVDHITVTHTAVPEPSTYALCILGLLGIYSLRRKSKK